MDQLSNIQKFKLWAKINKESNETEQIMIHHVESFKKTQDPAYLDLIILNAEQIKMLKQNIEKLNNTIDWYELTEDESTSRST